MLPYQSLHRLSRPDPAFLPARKAGPLAQPEHRRETLVIDSDLRDLGVKEVFCNQQASLLEKCIVYVFVGPEGRNTKTGKTEKSGWIL